jgi:hypothetical protein
MTQKNTMYNLDCLWLVVISSSIRHRDTAMCQKNNTTTCDCLWVVARHGDIATWQKKYYNLDCLWVVVISWTE